MYKVLCFFFLFTSYFHPNIYGTQVLPKEGGRLNYRVIGFFFPEMRGNKYTLEIAIGNFSTEALFTQNVIYSEAVDTNRVIATVPAFGKAYTWRVVYTNREQKKTNGILHHFSTMTTAYMDTTINRLRVMKQAEKYEDAYVLLDGTNTMYDMKGSLVWFLPVADSPINKRMCSDIKLTPQGTITFMCAAGAYEADYNGHILWQSIEDKTGKIHHEFTRLANGHYMGIGTEQVYWKLPFAKDSTAHSAADSERFYLSVMFGRIVELDKNSKITWQWKSSGYAKKSDLTLQKGMSRTNFYTHMHDNSFYFDEKRSVIYLSLRNINRVVKINYHTGTSLCTYGTIYKPGIRELSNDLFCGQHSCKATMGGDLYLYNNNTCEMGLPTIVLLKAPAGADSKAEKIWEYQCRIDDTTGIATLPPYIFSSGGNVMELPDQSMFVSMSEPYTKLFIVSREKQELWSAVIEKYDSEKKKWTPNLMLYRASIISNRKDLERLIWNCEKD